MSHRRGGPIPLRQRWLNALDPQADHPIDRALRGVHIAWMTLKEAFEDTIHIRSGFLALWAIEALIPMTMLTIAMARPLGYAAALERGLADLLGNQSIFGYTADDTRQLLGALLESASLTALGITGVISCLFIGWQLFVATTSDIHALQWQRMRHGTLGHLVRFVAFIVWTFALLGGGLASSLAAHGSAHAWLWMPAPILWSSACLAVGVWGFSAGTASWRGLAIGSLVGAVWWELLKSWFWIYTTQDFGTDALASLYRSAGFIPIFLFWMHLTFFSVLLSVIVTRQVDHFDAIWQGYVARTRNEQSARLLPSASLAQALWERLPHHEPRSMSQLACELRVHPSAVSGTLRQLVELNLLRECGVLVFDRADDAAQLTGPEVARRWRQDLSPFAARRDDV